MKTLRWSRRALLGALPVPLLTGCSSDPLSAQNYGGMLLKSGFNPFASPPPISREQAAAVSYASIGVTIGDGQQIMLVLATAGGQSRLWTSSSRIAIETIGGRIVRTGGMAKNLTGTSMRGTDPVATGFLGSDSGMPFSRNLDYADLNEFGAPVTSIFSAPSPTQIEILGAELTTLHVIETCSCQALGWDFENEYWADPDSGLIWRSVQMTHPDMSAVSIEILRPPKT